MMAQRTVFEILRTEQDAAADAALLAGLQDAEPPVAQMIVEILLSRNTKDSLLGLVQCFHLLDESLKQAVLIDWDRLFSVLREAGQSRFDQTRLNVLEIIRRARIYRAAYLVEAALRHRSAKLRIAAANTLCFLADELLRSAPAALSSGELQSMTPEQIKEEMFALDAHAEDRRQVVSGIETAISSFDVHHQAQVVEAALWFVDDMPSTFWSLMTTPGSRIAQAASQVMQRGLSPRLVPFAMAALHAAEFRPHILKTLAEGGDLALLEEWLRQAWRLVQPKTARSMNCIKTLACVHNYGQELFSLSSRSHRHLARWIASTSLASRERLEILQELLYRGDSQTRRAVLWALCGMADLQVNETLRNFHCPDDPELEQMARVELARRCPMEMPVSRLLAGRSWAEQPDRPASHETMTFERYWAAFDALRDEHKRRAGQQMLEASPLAHSLLARKFASTEPADRIRAIRMVAVLDLTEPFQEHLYQLCHDAKSEVRGAAVAALVPLQNAVSRRLAHNALQDEDSRVQANAVETVVALGSPSLTEDLIEKLGSHDNRVQANAVKALLKLGVREAAETLLKMLRHDNRKHRISALWLIERMGLFTLASRVAKMAAEDPDLTIRRRASVLTEHLPSQPEDLRPASAPQPVPASPARAPSEVRIS